VGEIPDFDEPDVEYRSPLRYGVTRIRVEIGKRRGDVRWFVVQLEENTGNRYGTDQDWGQVARFDHHPEADWGHDVREEGLHVDLYRNGRKVEVRRGFPDVPLNRAPAYSERYLTKMEKKIRRSFGPDK
jgi:hypothetical protein